MYASVLKRESEIRSRKSEIIETRKKQVGRLLAYVQTSPYVGYMKDGSYTNNEKKIIILMRGLFEKYPPQMTFLDYDDENYEKMTSQHLIRELEEMEIFEEKFEKLKQVIKDHETDPEVWGVVPFLDDILELYRLYKSDNFNMASLRITEIKQEWKRDTLCVYFGGKPWQECLKHYVVMKINPVSHMFGLAFGNNSDSLGKIPSLESVRCRKTCYFMLCAFKHDESLKQIMSRDILVLLVEYILKTKDEPCWNPFMIQNSPIKRVNSGEIH